MDDGDDECDTSYALLNVLMVVGDDVDSEPNARRVVEDLPKVTGSDVVCTDSLGLRLGWGGRWKEDSMVSGDDFDPPGEIVGFVKPEGGC